MRLTCEVRVASREAPAPGRALRSTLALTGEPGAAGSYSIILFSSLNKYGKKYKINNNIHQVFLKFCNEGKATIQFKSPPHDFFIQSDSIQLKLFLKTLKLCLDGNASPSDLSNISNVSVMPKNTIQTKLIIRHKEELPTKGLPRTLNTLQISGLQMCNFKREILTLRNIKILNLSDNCIEKIPPEVGNLPHLTELILNNNKLGTPDKYDWKWIDGVHIKEKLKLLDLSSNKLHLNIPQTIFKLRNLVTLKLDDNELSYLPNGIGTIKTLRYLSATKNNLTVLPGNLILLKLYQLDLSSNPLHFEAANNPLVIFKTKTLVELSSAVVIKRRIPYAKNTIPYTLVDYLDNSKYCICGTPTFDSKNYVKCLFSLKSFCETIISDRKYDVCFDCFLCSYQCFRKYVSRKRPRQN